MTAATALTESIQDSVLAAVENSQRWTAGAFKAFTSTLDGFTAPRSALPFSDALPTREDAMKVSFGFAERLLAANRAFVSELLGIASAPASTPTTAAGSPRAPVGPAPAPARTTRRPATT
jgi:hypothetical protein